MHESPNKCFCSLPVTHPPVTDHCVCTSSNTYLIFFFISSLLRSLPRCSRGRSLSRTSAFARSQIGHSPPVVDERGCLSTNGGALIGVRGSVCIGDEMSLLDSGAGLLPRAESVRRNVLGASSCMGESADLSELSVLDERGEGVMPGLVFAVL